MYTIKQMENKIKHEKREGICAAHSHINSHLGAFYLLAFYLLET